MDDLRFFNPYAEICHSENALPHWQQIGATYFLTFRLADSIPARLRNELNEDRDTWSRFHPEPWSPETEQEFHKRFSGAIERWLDAGYGSCLLRQNRCARIVDETIRHFDRQRLALVSSIVMPNHVHVIFVQNREWPLEKIILSWKTFTARNINKVLGRVGNLWQRSYFDRIIRDEEHFANCVRYIRRNPQRAGLASSDYILYEADLAKRIPAEMAC